MLSASREEHLKEGAAEKHFIRQNYIFKIQGLYIAIERWCFIHKCKDLFCNFTLWPYIFPLALPNICVFTLAVHIFCLFLSMSEERLYFLV